MLATSEEVQCSTPLNALIVQTLLALIMSDQKKTVYQTTFSWFDIPGAGSVCTSNAVNCMMHNWHGRKTQAKNPSRQNQNEEQETYQ